MSPYLCAGYGHSLRGISHLFIIYPLSFSIYLSVWSRIATNCGLGSFSFLMAEAPQQTKKNMSPDWFVQGTLTKIGDIFDMLTGRRWRPGSSLATSELIERLKTLLDAEVREDAAGRRFVPHNIQLKMQWDKFSTDEEKSLTALENEMMIAVIDHINDRHYYTYSPITIKVKPDYFTEGVKLFVTFDKMTGDDAERELHVSVPGEKKDEPAPEVVETVAEMPERKIRVRFTLAGKPVERIITLVQGKRISIGRTKENDIAIDDQSISKYHAALVLNSAGQVVVADTGSTNGTFIDAKRIPNGKALEVVSGKPMKFGSVEVTIDIAAAPKVEVTPEVKELSTAKTEVFKVGDFQFAAKKTEAIAPAAQPEVAKTEPAVNIPKQPDTLPATQPAIEIDSEDKRNVGG